MCEATEHTILDEPHKKAEVMSDSNQSRLLVMWYDCQADIEETRQIRYEVATQVSGIQLYAYDNRETAISALHNHPFDAVVTTLAKSTDPVSQEATRGSGIVLLDSVERFGLSCSRFILTYSQRNKLQDQFEQHPSLEGKRPPIIVLLRSPKGLSWDLNNNILPRVQQDRAKRMERRTFSGLIPDQPIGPNF